MAKGGGGKKRTYVRDGNGRFASTPGGGKPALKGGTLAKRTSLKKSRANLRAKDAADPSIRNTLSTRAQKGAVTRGNKALRAAKAASQRTAVGRSKVGTVSKTKRPPVLKTTVLKPESARVPAAQRPGSITNTLRGAMAALAKADAQRIREIESITGQKVRPTAAGTKAGKEAGARVRATAKKGKVADTLRAGLRELAQSDARTAREMASIVRDATPKVSGGKSGKALKGAKKVLPAAKSTEPRSARRQRTTVVPALQGRNKLAALSPQRRKVLERINTRQSVVIRAANEARDKLEKARNKAIPANNPYSDMTPKARKAALTRLQAAEKTYEKLRKSSLTVEGASMFVQGFAGATKEGYTRYDNAIRRSDIRTPKAKPSKPPTRTKGSKASLPRIRGTVAKPKGLKPGALAARRRVMAKGGGRTAYRTKAGAIKAQRARSRSIIEQTRGTVVGRPASYTQTAGGGERLLVRKTVVKQSNLFGNTDRIVVARARPKASQSGPAPGSKSARRRAGVNSRQKMSSEAKRMKIFRRVMGAQDLAGRKTLSVTERRAGREGYGGSNKRRQQSEKTQKRAAQYLDARRPY